METEVKRKLTNAGGETVKPTGYMNVSEVDKIRCPFAKRVDAARVIALCIDPRAKRFTVCERTGKMQQPTLTQLPTETRLPDAGDRC